MPIRGLARLALFTLCFLMALTVASATTPATPSFAPNYQLVFGQDFTAMTSLSQLKVSAKTMGTGTWIAHTPTNQDFFTFEDPSANYKPFGLGNGYLTIRTQQDGNDPNNLFGGFSSGLLSSMDSTGSGFAQKYGYFECSMWTPDAPNTWPAFWLLSAPNLTNSSLPQLAEIDVMESYGNYGTGPNNVPPGNPNAFSVAWHSWGGNGNATYQDGLFVNESGMTTGYHLYGVDVEPTGISWYFDRQLVWQAPIYAAAKQPLLLMVNLALGGGNYNNSTGTGYNWALTPNPTDLKIQYVAVWASPNSPNYTGTGGPSAPTGLSASGGAGQITLNWSASSGAASYDIYRGTSAGAETFLTTGISSTSYSDSAVSSGTTYYYVVAAVNNAGISASSNEASATPIAAAGGGALPSPWLNQDVGPTSVTGSSTYSGDTFTLQGAGPGAYFTPDAFQFAYQTVTGDCTIIARVATQANSNWLAHAGVMIRGSLANNSGFAEMTLLPNSGGAYFQYRADGGGPNGLFTAGTAPYWVKLSRSGNTFTGYVSWNGIAWTIVGSTTLTLPSAVYIGLLQASNTATLATATFDNVSVTGSGSTGAGSIPSAPTGLSASGGTGQIMLNWSASSGAASYNIYRGTSAGTETLLTTGITSTSYSDSAVSSGTTYYYVVAAVNTAGISASSNEASATPIAAAGGGNGMLPSPWLNQDVGTTGVTGSSTYTSGTFTLQGAGPGAFFTPDAFQFAYQTVTGDCTIIARVATQANSNWLAHAGVMIRGSLANNSGFAEITLIPNGGGTYFQYRADGVGPNGLSTAGTAPYWVKLSRSGNTFTGYVSSNGTTWTTVGSTTLTLPSAVYIGLLQASNTATLATATFDNVSVTGSGSTGVGSIPSAPTGLSASGGTGQIMLNWSASSGAASYDIYRGTSAGTETLLTAGITGASYTDSAVSNGTTYYYVVAAVNTAGISGNSNEASATPVAAGGGSGNGALPSPWLNQDVGTTGVTGTSTYTSGTFTLQGAGPGAFFTPDAFQFAYQTLTGDCTITARVATLANSNPFAHAGVMIRDGLGSNSGFAEITLIPNGGGAYFQYRANGGGPNNVSGTGTAPYWVKLSRVGNTFTGYVSSNGTTWTTVGSTTLSLPSAVYIGLLQASNTAALAASTFDNVSISQ